MSSDYSIGVKKAVTRSQPINRYRSRLVENIRKNPNLYIMVLPLIVFYFLFHYVPMAGLVISFQNFKPAKGLFGSDFVGFANFVSFFKSVYAFRVIRNTVLLSMYQLIFGFPAPIILALLINEIAFGKFKRTIQTISYMPHFISLVVICGLVAEFTRSDGLISQIVVMLGGEPKNYLLMPRMFRPIFVSSGIWQQVGWGSIIYLAKLSSIDPGLYEAARIDGAGRFRQAIHITLPSLIPIIVVLLIMRVGRIMSLGFEKVILLYSPLTYETADTISSYVYRRGLQEGKYSFGAAVGLFNSVINFIILVSANKLSRKISSESLW